MTPKIGLVLGSGAFRGIAHIGVLQVLHEQSIPVDMLAGCSIGAVVGSAYCAGQDPYALAEAARDMNDREYYDIVAPRVGLLKGERLQRFIEQLTGSMQIEDMPIPFAAVACDMQSGEEIIFRDGPAHEAVRGSLSIPGMFVPHEYHGYRLIDGGCMDRLPVKTVRAMGADVVIAVDVAYRGGPANPTGIADILLYAMDLCQWQSARESLCDADVGICPDLSGLSSATSATAELAVKRGREAAKLALPRIIEAIRLWEAAHP